MTNGVLLTGGLGYVGGRLALELERAGFSVYIGTRRGGLAPPDWLPAATMLQLDWESNESLISACNGRDAIVHLAAMDERASADDPIGALKINGLASLRLLEAAKLSGVKRFVYLSTAHIYGYPLSGDINELTLPRPIHPYAITHKVAEDLVLAAHDKRHIEGVVIRLSNSFGVPASPNVERWNLLVNDLCRQAATTGELRLKSAGSQLRDFVTLDDVSRAVVHLLCLDVSQLSDGLFNLGSGNSMSIIKMTNRVAIRWNKLTKRNIPIIIPVDQADQSGPLIYRVEKLLSTGFTLNQPIDREIDDTIKMSIKIFEQ